MLLHLCETEVFNEQVVHLVQRFSNVFMSQTPKLRHTGYASFDTILSKGPVWQILAAGTFELSCRTVYTGEGKLMRVRVNSMNRRLILMSGIISRPLHYNEIKLLLILLGTPCTLLKDPCGPGEPLVQYSSQYQSDRDYIIYSKLHGTMLDSTL